MVRNLVMKRKGGVGGCVGSGFCKWFLFNGGIWYVGIDLRFFIYFIKCIIMCLYYIVVEIIKGMNFREILRNYIWGFLI